MNDELFVTKQMVTTFHEQYVKESKKYPLLPKTLMLMKERGLLSENPLPVPVITSDMTIQEFYAAYERIPFEANRIINGFLEGTSKSENEIFPKDRDVFCVQHFHNFGEDDWIMDQFFSVTYVFGGKCILYFQDEKIILNPWDICILPPETRYSISPYFGTFAFEGIIRRSNFNLMFGELLSASSLLSDFFRSSLQKKNPENYMLIKTGIRDNELEMYLKEFTAECINDDIYANACAVSLMKLFLIRALQKYQDHVIIFDQSMLSLRPDARTIHDYIKNNFRDITLSQTADYFHYNPAYISRLISEHFDQSFSEIVTDMKISHAKEYLKNSSRRIADIAYLVGYSSADHFSRAFKMKTGLAPAFYRRKYNAENRL